MGVEFGKKDNCRSEKLLHLTSRGQLLFAAVAAEISRVGHARLASVVVGRDGLGLRFRVSDS